MLVFLQVSSICKNSVLLKSKYSFFYWCQCDLNRTSGAQNARYGGLQTKYHWSPQWQETSNLQKFIIITFPTLYQVTGLCVREVTTSALCSLNPTSSSGDLTDFSILSSLTPQKSGNSTLHRAMIDSSYICWNLRVSITYHIIQRYEVPNYWQVH